MNSDISSLLTSLSTIIGAAIPVLGGLALLVFLFGLLKFIASAGSEEAAKEGRRFMVYGVIALFVMVSVWGLVGTVNELTGIGQGGVGNLPQLPP